MHKQPSAHFGGGQEDDGQDGSDHAASLKRNKDGTLRKKKGRRTVGQTTVTAGYVDGQQSQRKQQRAGHGQGANGKGRRESYGGHENSRSDNESNPVFSEFNGSEDERDDTDDDGQRGKGRSNNGPAGAGRGDGPGMGVGKDGQGLGGQGMALGAQQRPLVRGRSRGRPSLRSKQLMEQEQENANQGAVGMNAQSTHQGGQGPAHGLGHDDEDYSNQLRSYQFDRPKNDVFLNFSNQQRETIYSNMDDLQQHRFDDFNSSGLHEKKVKDLMQELLGSKSKISDEVVQVFRAATKMYCGQLTEEARLVQIEEQRQRQISKGAQILPNHVWKLGPIKPHHLQEARRRLIQQNIFVHESPKSMFLRR